MNNAVRSKLSQMSNLEKEVLLSAEAEKVEMTLNTESAIASGLLIQRLTELYEDPIEASVRETISNALDAVSEAYSGKRPEVRVSAPSSLSPILTIKDNGVGMTYDDLKEIYSKYGASTKIDNLEQIGAYGLGAKSPLAYGTEFTVTSVKDNQKTTIIVAREELTNYIKIVSAVNTDEPSGTSVSIPVSNYDVDRFNENINKYKETPIDKDVDLYINGELIKDTKHSLITNKALILDSDEKVYGRVWIDSSDVVRLITELSEDDIRKSLKFLIGGWAYESPTARGRNRYYSRSNSSIIVELKAGIVGFNSSRDAILENERYSALENLVIEYIRSAQFMKDLTKGINKLEIEEFKRVLAKLLEFQRRYAKIEDGKIIVDNSSSNRNSYSNIPRNFNFEDFTHEATGFNLNQLLANVPDETEPTIVLREQKTRYHKAVRNALMYETLNHSMFEDDNVSEINLQIDKVMNDEVDGHELDVLMVNLATLVYNEENVENIRLTFITDIEDEDQVRKLKSGRKSIVRMRNEDNSEDLYSSILVYTKHSKSAIEKMIEDVKFDNVDLMIRDIDEILELLKEFRAKHKVVREKRKEKLSTNFIKYNVIENYTEGYNIESISKSRNNVIIVTKDNYIDKDRLKMMHAWYCNENEITKENLDMYVSAGNHTVSDVNILTEECVVLRDPSSDHAGLSKAYRAKIHDNVAELNAVRNDSVNTSERAFMRLITGVYGYSASSLKNAIENNLENAYELAKLTDIELPEFPKSKLNAIAEYDNHTFSDMGYYSRWRLEDSAIEHLMTLVNKEDQGLLQDLIAMISEKRIVIDEDGKLTIAYDNVEMRVNVTTARRAYSDDESTNNFNKLVRAQVEAYVEFVKSIVEEMSLINF